MEQKRPIPFYALVIAYEWSKREREILLSLVCNGLYNCQLYVVINPITHCIQIFRIEMSRMKFFIRSSMPIRNARSTTRASSTQ